MHLKSFLFRIEYPYAVFIYDHEGNLLYIFENKGGSEDGFTNSAALCYNGDYRNKAKLSEEELKRPGGAAFSAGGEEATEECLINIHKMLDTMGVGY